MGYRTVRHKTLDEERCDFLIRKADDPELTIDLFLIAEYFVEQDIEAEADYINGWIKINGGSTLLYVQPYNGYVPSAEMLVEYLDEESDNWFTVYHSRKFVAPIMTEELKPKLIERKNIPMNVEEIIKTKIEILSRP